MSKRRKGAASFKIKDRRVVTEPDYTEENIKKLKGLKNITLVSDNNSFEENIGKGVMSTPISPRLASMTMNGQIDFYKFQNFR